MNDQQYVIVPKTAKQVPQILADFLANSELTTNVTITVPTNVSVYDLLNNQSVIMSKAAVKALEEVLI